MLLSEFNTYACTQENQLNNFRWTLRETLARKASSNVWGQGFTFQSIDPNTEKIFKKFDIDNRLLNFFAFAEKNCSLYGRAIITINRTQSGDIQLSLSNPFYFTGIGKAFTTPQIAVIYQRFTIDNINYIVKSTYTTKYVKNEVYYDNDGNVMVFDEQTQILKELQIKPYWAHNLGFVPVLELTNLPYFQYNFNNWEYVSITDWYPAYEWEKTLYIAKKNFEKELVMNHSRLILENVDQRVMQEIRSVEYGDTGIDIGDFWIEADNGATAKVQPGMGDFAKYTQAINGILDFYFKFAGVSKFSEGGGAQKTVAETSTIRSQLIESMNQKINLRTNQVSQLITMILSIYGVKDPHNFTFKINGNILKDETSYIDNIIKKIQNGIISVTDAIQDIFNLSQSEAQAHFERVKKFNDENDIVTGISGFEEQEQGEITETGEHPNRPDKQGVE